MTNIFTKDDQITEEMLLNLCSSSYATADGHLGILDVGVGSHIEPPVQHKTYGVKHGKSIQSIFRRREIDLLAKHLGYDKG